MLKPLCTRRKPPNPNQIIFFCDEAKILTRMERQTDRMTDNVFWPWGCPHCHAQPGLAEGQPDGPLVEGNVVVSQLNRLQPFRLQHFMWWVVEREVNQCPHITLASLRAMTSDVMPDLDREVIIHACKKFGLGLWLLWRPLRFSINKCVCYMHINFPWKMYSP